MAVAIPERSPLQVAEGGTSPATAALDYSQLREIVGSVAPITREHIDFPVDKNDAEQLAILAQGQNASSAIAEYLKNLDAETTISAKRLTERSAILASLRAQIGK